MTFAGIHPAAARRRTWSSTLRYLAAALAGLALTVVPPGTLWAGVPARMRRELGEKDRALILEYAQNYLDYVDIYLAESSR